MCSDSWLNIALSRTFNSLSANPTKWSTHSKNSSANSRQIVWVFDQFVKLALKGLRRSKVFLLFLLIYLLAYVGKAREMSMLDCLLKIWNFSWNLEHIPRSIQSKSFLSKYLEILIRTDWISSTSLFSWEVYSLIESNRLHDFSVDTPRCYKDVYVKNSVLISPQSF